MGLKGLRRECVLVSVCVSTCPRACADGCDTVKLKK